MRRRWQMMPASGVFVGCDLSQIPMNFVDAWLQG